ncbi:hypothetical protein PMAYCL1PPCAC_29845, partial [Pristionchus mayeri]
FARQWRKRINCSRLHDKYSFAVELALITSNEGPENVTASFRPCEYKLPICQLPPTFPSVDWNNLVYMRIIVLSLASLFVLIPTLIVCFKYRRHAHPFVWLNQHAASLRDLTERSENVKSTKLDLKAALTPNACTVPLNGGVNTTTTTATSAESKSKIERKGKTAKRNNEWPKVGKSIDAEQQAIIPPPVPPPLLPPLDQSVSAHEFFPSVNVEGEKPKK